MNSVQLSVAVAGDSSIVGTSSSHSYVASGAQVISGATSSVKVMYWKTTVSLPHSSVAVIVLSTTPIHPPELRESE